VVDVVNGIPQWNFWTKELLDRRERNEEAADVYCGEQ
jgi:hypothetical protein